MRCRSAIEETCAAQGVHCTIRFKHLFHDREEVTGYVLRDDATSTSRKKSRRRHDQ
jgi:23S rRNA C2498 (ribose-2'-O)-methylase RlmM